MNVIEKFWKNVEKTNSCWNWTGPLCKKYKSPIIHKTAQHGNYSPRKIAFLLNNKEAPHFLYVSCGNNLCVNPEHIYYKTAEDFFWEKINKTETCWLWIGVKHNSYGQFTVQVSKNKSKQFRAHRYSYSLKYGEIPKGMFICHKCDNRSCVNPDHLFLGSPKDNSQDRDSKEKLIKRIFSKEEKENIIKACNIVELSKQYNTSIHAITNVIYDFLLEKEKAGDCSPAIPD